MQSGNQIKKVERLGGSKIRGIVVEEDQEQLGFIDHPTNPNATKK